MSKQKRHRPEEIASILKQHEAGLTTADAQQLGHPQLTQSVTGATQSKLRDLPRKLLPR